MTLKPAAPAPGAAKIIPFPDPPPDEMTGYYKVNFPGYPGALADHLSNPETTIITSEVAAALLPSEDWEGVRYPDLLISFNANPAANIARSGYLIPEQGKPPDFVLEVASETTGKRDETVKRDAYAAMGVPEYWRFDPSGGIWHSAHLAGDRLVDGEYQPITIYRTEAGHYWGHSDALNLDLCWEDGDLRLYDPVSQRYLTTYLEERAARRAEAARADEERAARRAEAARADAAETRVRQLEEQLSQLQAPGSPETK